MKTRIALVVIGLVILPTAMLSLMAGRALRSWELVLQRGLETTAANAVEAVADQTQASLVQDLKRVKTSLVEALASGGGNERIEAAAAQLSKSGGSIEQVCLFVNPLGFVYPLPPPPSVDASVPSEQGGTTNRLDPLMAALKREIAAAPAADTIRFTVDDASYLFSPVRERQDLYAGYRVDPARFAKQLSETIAGVSGGGFLLVAEGPGLHVGAPRQSLPSEVVVSDSLGRETAIRDGQGGDRDAQPLAVGRLYRPLDFVKVSAFIRDPEAVARAGKLHMQLYGWGILLLAGVIVAGVWLALRDAAAEIRRARARGDVVIGVSHDLRTPLASMRMLADSLYMGRVPDPEKQKQFLGTIVRECQRLNQLIERVLFFVRFGQDALVYRPRDTDVGLIVTREVDAFRTSVAHVASATGAPGSTVADEISMTIQPGLPRVMADDGALGQVVLNLLDNAWKYGRKVSGVGCQVSEEKSEHKGREGGAQPNSATQQPDNLTTLPPCAMRHAPCDSSSITVTVDSVEETRRRLPWGPRRRWIRISVADRGEGIRKGDLRKVFRRFYRASGAGEKNTSGVGLGLALCKHVAEGHGGWIDVKSTVGMGSTFSVYLPVGGL